MAPRTRSQVIRGLLQPLDTNTIKTEDNVVLKNNSTGKKNKEEQKKNAKKKQQQSRRRNPKINLAKEFEKEIVTTTTPKEEKEEESDEAVHPREWTLGDFEILCVLGEGAQSRVVKGRHKSNGKMYAIKQIDYTINRKYADRELTIHSNLKDHIGIVKFHGYCFVNGDKAQPEYKTQLCLFLEYCPHTLLDKIKNEGCIEEKDAAHIVSQLVDVLFYLHQHHIIHRDIKLANILVAETSSTTINTTTSNNTTTVIKMADFGIAVQARDPKIRKTIIGTQGYTAPEIDGNMERTQVGEDIYQKAQETGKYELPPVGIDLFDSQYTSQVDIWSLGVTLLAMLTGKIPGDDEEENNSDFDLCFDKGLYSNPTLEIPDWLSSSCVDLLQGLLEEDPNHRLTLDEVKSHPWVTLSTNEK